MIDLHAHILPKMDDGSKSVEESIEMLTEMYQEGIATVVATPHFDMRRESVEEFLERREHSYQKLMAAATDVDIPKVLLGAEVLYCGVGLSRIDNIEKLCLGCGRYLLVETLRRVWEDSFSLDMRKLMVEQNITPILAHVERTMQSRKNRKVLKALQAEGVMAQSNAEFFLSWRSRRTALKMLKEKKIQVLGSDCHNMRDRKPNLAGAMGRIQEKLGEKAIQKLVTRAERVLSGEMQ